MQFINCIVVIFFNERFLYLNCLNAIYKLHQCVFGKLFLNLKRPYAIYILHKGVFCGELSRVSKSPLCNLYIT